MAVDGDGANATRPDVVAIVLAAGAGARLAPLSELTPKALCPVANRPLLDLALDRVRRTAALVAVNLHHGADQVRAHLETGAAGAVHLSEEQPEALGTAGAVGALRSWIDGRDVLVVNADAWAPDDPGDLVAFVREWDGERPRVLVHGRSGFGPRVGVVASLLPWSTAQRLRPVPSGLYESVWRIAAAEGRLEATAHGGPFVDCGTPGDYLRANLAAAALAGGPVVDPTAEVDLGRLGARSVVGASCRVEGALVDSVMWPRTTVGAGEELVRAVRASARLTLGPLADESGPPG